MRIIGIDPGSVVTGLGIIEVVNGTFKVLAYDALKMNSKQPIPSRLKMIYDFCAAGIEKYKPDELSVETAFFGKNIQSTMKLGQVRGAVMIAALNSGLRVFEYSPREVKKSVTGSGSASKPTVQTFIKNILSVKEDKMLSDSSDALAIALCHYFSGGEKIQAGKSRGRRQDWKQFIEKNPDKILRRKK